MLIGGNDTIGEVVSVRRANDILRTMKEGEAFNFGAKMRATYGASWRSFFYELDVAVGQMLVSARPNDVLEVLDPP